MDMETLQYFLGRVGDPKKARDGDIIMSSAALADLLGDTTTDRRLIIGRDYIYHHRNRVFRIHASELAPPGIIWAILDGVLYTSASGRRQA